MPQHDSHWVKYNNGNYTVALNLKDGTKIRETQADEFIATRPESMDVKITNKCWRGCPFCHEDSRFDGKQADIEFANLFISSCPPYTEIAVGGGNVLEDPEHTEQVLVMLRNRQCIPSLTVHQEDFLANLGLLASWYENGLVFGIGVSLSDSSEPALVPALLSFPTAVLHIIAGVIDRNDFSRLANKGLKVLILGYKNIRRGHDYLTSHNEVVSGNMKWLADNLGEFMKGFKVCSFDNLALEQLPVRNLVGEEMWKSFYMGDDGTATFYVDLVERQFAESSTSLDRHDIMVFNENGERYGFWPVEKMFSKIRDSHQQGK